jgi:hypothetical protein
MKNISFSYLLLFLLTFDTVIFSQNDVKNYVPPPVIEGSNLNLSFSNGMSNNNYFNDESNRSFNIGGSADFLKWRLSKRLNYSVSIYPFFSYYKSTKKTLGIEESSSSASAALNITAGMNYYVFKSFYTGIYVRSFSEFGKNYYPYFSESVSPFVGFGRLVNAQEVTAADNLENDLFKLKLINKKIPTNIKKKLIELIDKWNNREFTSKFKDDDYIEFFSEIENLLVNNRVVSKEFNSRTTLTLYQTLFNRNYIYLPFFKGYEIQLAANFNYLKESHEPVEKFLKDLTLSVLWGYPINTKTGLILKTFFSFPIDDKKNNFPYTSNLYSPAMIRLLNTNYYVYELNPPYRFSGNFDYLAGLSIKGFYYLSPTSALLGDISTSHGKITNQPSCFRYSFSSSLSFIYNILSRLNLDAGISYYHNTSSDFYFHSGIQYIVF